MFPACFPHVSDTLHVCPRALFSPTAPLAACLYFICVVGVWIEMFSSFAGVIIVKGLFGFSVKIKNKHRKRISASAQKKKKFYQEVKLTFMSFGSVTCQATQHFSSYIIQLPVASLTRPTFLFHPHPHKHIHPVQRAQSQLGHCVTWAVSHTINHTSSDCSLPASQLLFSHRKTSKEVKIFMLYKNNNKKEIFKWRHRITPAAHNAVTLCFACSPDEVRESCGRRTRWHYKQQECG